MRRLALTLLLASAPTWANLPDYHYPQAQYFEGVGTTVDLRRHYSVDYIRCLRAKADDMLARANCDEQETTRQARRLDNNLRIALGRLPPSRMSELRSGEGFWENWLGIYCHRLADLADPDDGGGRSFSLDRSITNECIINETIRRTIWLEKLR